MRKWGLVLIITLVGCSRHKQDMNIKVSLTNNNRSINISGFDKEVIDDIAQNSADSAWLSLLPVYKMPADTDMKDFQSAQPGKYKVAATEVIFTPDTPFRQGQMYFLRTFDYSGAKDAWDFVRKQKGKGSAVHKDLLFKY